jgi:hypothetical protein
VLAANNVIIISLNEEKSNIPYSKLEKSYNKIQAVNLEQKSQYILIVIYRKKIFNEYEDGLEKYSMQKRLVLELFLSSSLSYFFLIFSALSGLVAVSVAPLVPGDLVLAASRTSQPRNSVITAIWY